METGTSPPALGVLESALKRVKKEHAGKSFHYAVPGLWLSGGGGGTAVNVDPFDFYLGAVREALKSPPPLGRPAGAPPPRAGSAGEWTREQRAWVE